jgi:hypothetical protein
MMGLGSRCGCRAAVVGRVFTVSPSCHWAPTHVLFVPLITYHHSTVDRNQLTGDAAFHYLRPPLFVA